MATLTMHTKNSEAHLAHQLRQFKAEPSASFIIKLNAMNAAAATTIGAATAVATATSLSCAAKTSAAGLSSVLTAVGGSKGAIVVLTLSLGVSIGATQREPEPRPAAPEVAHAMTSAPSETETDSISNVGRSAGPSDYAPRSMPAPAVASQTPIHVTRPSKTAPNRAEEPSRARPLESKPKHAPAPKPRHVSTLPDEQRESYVETVHRWRSGLDKCQREAREAGSRQLSGAAEVKLLIGKNGLARADSIEFDSSSVLNPELIECVKLGISRWQFERRDKLVELSFKLDFAP